MQGFQVPLPCADPSRRAYPHVTAFLELMRGSGEGHFVIVGSVLVVTN
jgi:hypothetical protein